ncbi:ATP12 family chaperone protein [Paremcibacter congregatus]|uniref:ATPase n=1 Tax=Paremcibacter congregatus TaxID=2043170 RepID=A0A2G4YTS4_9PROT|nr:ATP12 family protein [Paremcibacter congregatus]PHZ85650.1 ATPase [Paremcibacter congregatus]QDE26610.1 ATPase [Paremcibacter congregatus]
MKRFFKQATVEEDGSGYVVKLDGRSVKTPEKRQNICPNRAIAEAICAEWNAQGDEIKPASMLITKMQNTAIDRVGARRADLEDELVKYAGTDLLCYRADYPADLVVRQETLWQPLLDWVLQSHDIALKSTTGIIHVAQDDSEMDKFRDHITGLDDFTLMAFYNITTLCGSVSIGLNVLGNNLTAEEAWAAAELDENYQIDQWGLDDEAKTRQDNMKSELNAAIRFLELLHQT